MLKKMETPDRLSKRIPFSIAFITADRAAWAKKKRMQKELEALVGGTEAHNKLKAQINMLDVGGRIVRHENCVLSGLRGMHAKKSTEQKSSHVEMQKNPNHWRNRTRNIVFLPSQQMRKCHISLIVKFNGQEVIY
jgi:hypothetical protein